MKLSSVWAAWEDFWFSEGEFKVLGIIRVSTGIILFYTHLIWSFDLEGFLGKTPWFFPYSPPWDLFSYIASHGMLVAVHSLFLFIIFLFAVGLWTRVTTVLAWLIHLTYSHRLYDVSYGLEQVLAILLFCLLFGSGRKHYSIDTWFGKSKSEGFINSTFSLRLIQLHLCLVYFFSGLGKLGGSTWKEGTALWRIISSSEFQSVDLTWLVHCSGILKYSGYLLVAWELTYPFLIWVRKLRPYLIGIAVLVHASIGLCLGMWPFGLIMIVANLAFLDPKLLAPKEREPSAGQ